MATYKTVLRTALEYASYIWSPLASSTSINNTTIHSPRSSAHRRNAIEQAPSVGLLTLVCGEISRHLATRDNNKIMRTPPPHISRSEETCLPHLSHPCPTQNKQISLLQIILTQSQRQITSITTMPPLQHSHHHLFNCIHIRTTLSPLDV